MNHDWPQACSADVDEVTGIEPRHSVTAVAEGLDRIRVQGVASSLPH
jgi:hypothetical protein